MSCVPSHVTLPLGLTEDPVPNLGTERWDLSREGRGEPCLASAVGGAGGLAGHPALAPKLLVLPCPLPGPTATGSEPQRLPAGLGSARAHPPEGSSSPQVRPRGWGKRA